jgi:hypothetical protein
VCRLVADERDGRVSAVELAEGLDGVGRRGSAADDEMMPVS